MSQNFTPESQDADTITIKLPPGLMQKLADRKVNLVKLLETVARDVATCFEEDAEAAPAFGVNTRPGAA